MTSVELIGMASIITAGLTVGIGAPITAIGVDRNLKSEPKIDWKTWVIGLSSPRIDFQAIVRIRYEVKNGTTTRPISRSFHRPPLVAMKYASG